MEGRGGGGGLIIHATHKHTRLFIRWEEGQKFFYFLFGGGGGGRREMLQSRRWGVVFGWQSLLFGYWDGWIVTTFTLTSRFIDYTIFYTSPSPLCPKVLLPSVEKSKDPFRLFFS
jgi:hypothetical protein